MIEWSTLVNELAALGAQRTPRGNVIAHVGAVRVLVYRAQFDETDYAGFMVAVAPAAQCDPARILTLAPTLVSAPVVVNDIVSLRHFLPVEVISVDLARRTIATVAHDGKVFGAALGVRDELPSITALGHYVD